MVMPLQKPLQLCCPQCGWCNSKVIRSDVLPPRIPCPQCGSETTYRPVSLWADVQDKLKLR